MAKKAPEMKPADVTRRLREFLAAKPEFAEVARGPLQIEFTGRQRDFWIIDPDGRVRRGRSKLPELVVRMAWSHFRELVTHGRATHWFAAYRNEQIRVEGDPALESKLLQMLMALADEES